MYTEWQKTCAGLSALLKGEDAEECPFCGSHSIDSNFVDGRKASPSECMECGATEIHPYYDDKSKLTDEEVSTGWKRNK